MPGDYSRDMYDPQKNYLKTRVQKGIPWVDADENDRSDIHYEHVRRLADGLIGTHFIDDALKCVGDDADNDFLIKAGYGFVRGHCAYLHEDVRFVNDGSNISEKNICAQSDNLSNEVLEDLDMKWITDELIGRELQPNIGHPDTFLITGNTATTITCTGGTMLANAQASHHYQIRLSTPGDARLDFVYLNYWMEEIDSIKDPDLIHALGTGVEGQLRIKGRTLIQVAEGSGVYTDYVDNFSVQHYLVKIAEINRDTNAVIEPDEIVEKRIYFSPGMLTRVVEGIKGAVDYYSELPDPDADGWSEGIIYIVRNDSGAPSGNGLYWTVGIDPPRTWAFLDNLNLQNAAEVGYDNAGSGLAAADVQDAVDELSSEKLDDIQNVGGGNDVYKERVGAIASLRTVIAGAGIQVNELANELQIINTLGGAGPGGFSSVGHYEVQASGASQTIFTIVAFVPAGDDTLNIYRNGQRLTRLVDYTLSDDGNDTTVTIIKPGGGFLLNDEVLFIEYEVPVGGFLDGSGSDLIPDTDQKLQLINGTNIRILASGNGAQISVFPQGSTSALDADLLDGQHAADIIAAGAGGPGATWFARSFNANYYEGVPGIVVGHSYSTANGHIAYVYVGGVQRAIIGSTRGGYRAWSYPVTTGQQHRVDIASPHASAQLWFIPFV